MFGTVIAKKYRLTRELGRGGMGSVWEAHHVSTGRRVAVKLMKVSDTQDEAERARVLRFQREALAAGRLETQHVVQVYDAGICEDERQPFLVMEILDGEDVSQLIKRLGPLRPELALAIVAQVCAALGKAHDAGVIHRDIKPSNIFLSRNEYGDFMIKVLDFGIAKVRQSSDVNDAAGTITETGTLVGSPHYMSPEQAKSLKTIDHRTDLWSLGVVLHKCLSGRTPFDGFGTLGQVIVAVCTEDAVSVQEHAPWVSPELSLVLRNVLRRDPAQRYQTAYDMLEAIKPHLPEGPRISEEMLVPLGPNVRGMIAPRRSDFPTELTPPVAANPALSDTGPSGPTSSNKWLAAGLSPATGSGAWHAGRPPMPTGTATMEAPAAPPRGQPSSPELISMTGASFVAGESLAPKDAPRRRSKVWALALVGVIVAIGGSVVAWPRVRLLTNTASAAPATAATTTAATPASASSEPSVTPTSDPAPAAPPKVMRSDRVTITAPRDAKVEINGAPARIESGSIVVEGAPGSVHHVKVKVGARETTTDVILTESGPRPAQVAFAAAASAPVAKAPAVAAMAAPPPVKPAAAAPAKPAAPARPATGFDQRFE